VVGGEPIPWNADAVLVDVHVWFPVVRPSAKSDFYLDVIGEPPLLPVSQTPAISGEESARVLFRMAAPHRATRVALHWRSRLLEEFIIPTLSQEHFLDELRIEAPSLFARLGDQNVPCEAVVEGQCRGLLAGAVLRSPTSLLPIIDLRPSIEMTLHRTRQTLHVPILLTSRQLAGREAMVNVNIPPRLRPEGGLTMRWTVAGRTYARRELRTLSPQMFRQSLFAIDSRYLYSDRDGTLGLSRYLYLQENIARLGPCFLVASREPGLAGLHTFQVRTQYKDPEMLPEYLEQEVLVTDGPSLFTPLTTSPEQFQRFSSFDLFSEGKQLAQLSLCTRDVARFTNEGGFCAPDEYPWSPIAEEELADHLRKLMDAPHPFQTGS
jgi:hypothetical protein